MKQRRSHDAASTGKKIAKDGSIVAQEYDDAVDGAPPSSDMKTQ